MTDVYEAIRTVNLWLAVAVTIAIGCRFGGFLRAPLPSKLGRLAVFAWVSSTGYGTLEALHQNATPGMRIPTVTSVLLLSAYWVGVEWREDRAARRAETAAVAALLPRQRSRV